MHHRSYQTRGIPHQGHGRWRQYLNSPSRHPTFSPRPQYWYIIACAIEHNTHTAKKGTPSWLNRLLDKLNDLDFLVLPMKDIISYVGYSQEYICREFKKHTGTTLSKYIRKMKCMHSLSLLEDTDIPVVNIASMLYFPDESNYITNFRKIYNVTPGEWRRRVRGKQTKV
jgi:AraC-like DNA-binding protein